MAAKKKSKKKQTKKKQTKKKQTAAVTRKPVRKKAIKKPAKKKFPPKKKLAKNKTALKKAVVKAKTQRKKIAGGRIAGATSKRTSAVTRDSDIEAFTSQELRTRSAGQSGSLQGLSNVEGADSESVDELIEEGNAFEADVVAGVERADDTDEEVHTHEVPEDDVPGEYLDEE
jgi:hypothetical protein